MRIVRVTASTVTSWRPGPISYGSRTSPTSRRGGASSTSPSSSTCSRDALSAGACRLRSARTSSSMRLSRPSTIVAVTARATWCITADRGTQYVSMRYTERLADAGIALSVGSRGDAYDNALAEHHRSVQDGGESTTRPVAAHRRGRIRHARVVDWFNTRRLLEPSATSRRRNMKSVTMSRLRWPNSRHSLSDVPGTVHHRSRASGGESPQSPPSARRPRAPADSLCVGATRSTRWGRPPALGTGWRSNGRPGAPS